VFSMRWGGRLAFPLFHPMKGSLAENLSGNFNLGMPPVVFPDFETNQILDALQTVSSIMDIPNVSLADKKAISKAVYNTEHKLLSMEYAQGGPSAHQETQISPISYAFTLAAVLYLEVIIREHPCISKVHFRLTTKLHTFLSKSNPSWYRFESLPYRDILLWIMFVILVASPPDMRRDNSTTLQYSENLDIEESTKEVLRRRLKRIAWRERICGHHLDRIWKGMRINPSQ
jgi:hypothetical protein